MSSNFVLMQNNAKLQSLAITMNVFQYYEIRTMNWSPLCPNLDLIKHLWNLLDRRFQRRSVLLENIQKLTDELVDEWRI